MPVSFGYNIKLGDNFGLAPKMYGILKSQLGLDEYSTEPTVDFAFGAGANLNIGDRFSIGLGYEWNPDTRCEPSTSYNNAHANVTYYIFSK